jgi:hypothetical protein
MDVLDGVSEADFIDNGLNYITNDPCPTCHIPPLSIICTTCPPTSLPHTRHQGCPTCGGKVLTPIDSPTPDVWMCACILWEREYGEKKIAKSEELVGGGMEWDDEVVWEVERGDRILAEKLHAEWRAKQGA